MKFVCHYDAHLPKDGVLSAMEKVERDDDTPGRNDYLKMDNR